MRSTTAGPRRALRSLGLGLALALVSVALSWHVLASGFTAAMGKRRAPGPFDFAPIIQGDANDAYALADDVLSASRGSSLAGNFYSNIDTDQGSIVLWWTPEYGSADLSGPGDHYLGT